MDRSEVREWLTELLHERLDEAKRAEAFQAGALAMKERLVDVLRRGGEPSLADVLSRVGPPAAPVPVAQNHMTAEALSALNETP